MDDIKIPLKKGLMSDIEASGSSSQQDEEMEVDGSSSQVSQTQSKIS